MIVSFSVSNFRSFASEETISLVASSRLRGRHDDHTVQIPDSNERALRTAVLYGANGAGKSNLFKALQYLKSMALSTRKKGSGTQREKFVFSEGLDDASSFDVQFIVNEQLYRFGMKVDDLRVREEWLIRVIGGRERVLYERVTDEANKVTIDASGLKGSGGKLLALATVGGPPNQSFLATIQATLDVSELTDELREVIRWFEHSLHLVKPGESFLPVGHLLASDPEFEKFASEFLKASSTGVDYLEPIQQEVSEEEMRKRVPQWTLSELLDTEGNDSAVSLRDGEELVVERKGNNRYFHIAVRGAHKHSAGMITSLNWSEESDGTRRLLNLVPALYHLRKSSVTYFVDEVDRSLHPILVWNFLQFFLKSCAGRQSQIILTTHESNLLDLDLLRRDEIWFAEKNPKGATQLYSLTDFKVRNDLQIRKHYLDGRFGAIPFLGNLDRLRRDELVEQ